MSKADVSTAIQNCVKEKHKVLIAGRIIPDSVHNVLATLQEEYVGAGKYRVVFDIDGAIADENGIKENEHFTSEAYVSVSPNEEGEPVPHFEETLFLTKR